jgi:cytochrome o ubiquinol oxidase subunit 2
MGKKYKLALLLLIPAAVICLVLFLARAHPPAVLHPQGTIGLKERDLMVTATLLMLIVVVPVFILTFFISWRYREDNKTARYSPNWDGSRVLEFIWWALPCAIILVLAIVTWNSSHELDPFKPIAGPNPINIQVVALQWKWLFIYPEQHIATVNYVQFPTARPVNFSITSDAPMNSFWIPSLGGQVYAMSGMDMKLHLIADADGQYQGSSANISGRGFAGMKFIARSSSQADFDSWVGRVQKLPNSLNMSAYQRLALPSENNPAAYYSKPALNLYDRVVLKYILPASQISENSTLASARYGGAH